MIRKSVILLFSAFSYSLLCGQAFAQEYRIALILPFQSNGDQSNLTDAMLDYYEGFKMAAMDLEQEGLKLRLHVYDGQKDSGSLDRILAHPDMKKMDVIIGPVYDESLKVAEAFCKQHHILLVSPLKFYTPGTSNSRLLNFFVPDSVRVSSIADKCTRYFPRYQYVIAADNSTESKRQAGELMARFKALNIRNAKIVSYNNGKITGYLPADSVILISTVPALDSRSALLKSIKYIPHAFLIGQIDWYSKIQSTLGVDEPRLIYPEVNFVSYADSFATNFRNRFFDLYVGEPSKFAYIAYDQATYICYGLMTFGSNFDSHIPNAEFRGLINVIRLQRTSMGYLNMGLNYIRIIEEERQEYTP